MNNKIACSHYSTIVLSAGLSSRMGECKQLLPWGSNSVLGSIIKAYQEASVEQIIVVSGGYRVLVEAEAKKYAVDAAFNARFDTGEMIDSVKTGLKKVIPESDGIFIALGDQPMVTVEDIFGLKKTFELNKDKLVIPSYSFRRGHPWLIPQKLRQELLELEPPKTLRDFINSHKEDICYYEVKSSHVLQDLDTPDEYDSLKPKSS